MIELVCHRRYRRSVWSRPIASHLFAPGLSSPPVALRRRALLKWIAGGAALSAVPAMAIVGSTLLVSAFRGTGRADRNVLQAAFDVLRSGRYDTLELEAGRTYDLGDLAPSEFALRLQNVTGVAIKGNGASFICNTARKGQTQMILIQACRDIAISDLTGRDRGANMLQNWRGMDFIHCDGTAGPTTGLRLTNVSVDGAVSLFTCTGSGNPGEPRSGRFTFSGLVARNCYYGVSFQENGDDAVIDLATYECRRSYVGYGIARHSVDLRVRKGRAGPGADACVLIKRYRRDTSDIAVRATFDGTMIYPNFFKLEHQVKRGESGVIRNIDLALDLAANVENANGGSALGISAYRDDKQVSVSSDRWQSIRLRGCMPSIEKPVRILTQASTAANQGISVDVSRCV